MPIYEYHCLDCGKVFEKIVPLHTDTMNCQSCESDNVEKLFSAFAVQSNDSASGNSSQEGCTTCGAARPGMCREMLN